MLSSRRELRTPPTMLYPEHRRGQPRPSSLPAGDRSGALQPTDYDWAPNLQTTTRFGQAVGASQGSACRPFSGSRRPCSRRRAPAHRCSRYTTTRRRCPRARQCRSRRCCSQPLVLQPCRTCLTRAHARVGTGSNGIGWASESRGGAQCAHWLHQPSHLASATPAATAMSRRGTNRMFSKQMSAVKGGQESPATCPSLLLVSGHAVCLPKRPLVQTPFANFCHQQLPPCRRARSSGCSTRRRRRCWRAWSASRSAAEHKPRSSRRALFVLTPRCPPPPERRQQRQARRLAAAVRRRLARALMGHRARRLDTVLPPCSPARIHLTAHRTVHDRRRRRRLARLWPRRVPRGCGR